MCSIVFIDVFYSSDFDLSELAYAKQILIELIFSEIIGTYIFSLSHFFFAPFEPIYSQKQPNVASKMKQIECAFVVNKEP